MNEMATRGPYGTLREPGTLWIERSLPGTVDRVWQYLTDSELRSRWLAAGEMTLEVGAPFELVWRNDTLTSPPGTRPDGFGPEHRMQCRITELDPPIRIGFTWGEAANVQISLKQSGERVLLTLVHRGLVDRAVMLNVSAGWHAHLDVLLARASGHEPSPFWDGWIALKQDYDARLPALPGSSV